MTAREIGRLLPELATEHDLAVAISTAPSLRSRFELRQGYLREREGERAWSANELDSREAAKANMDYASRFVPLLRSARFMMVAVSGSTSYGSASRSKDLDLFCVTKPGLMWVALTEALLMARVSSLFHRAAPKVCLSCTMDEGFAYAKFASTRDPLFARDALETKVVMGRDTYLSLMRSAGWISAIFPFAYRNTAGPGSSRPRSAGTSKLGTALNLLLFHTVGRYMRRKAELLNRKLESRGSSADVFAARSGTDHLIYESRRYSRLRRLYSSVLLSSSAALERPPVAAPLRQT